MADEPHGLVDVGDGEVDHLHPGERDGDGADAQLAVLEAEVTGRGGDRDLGAFLPTINASMS